MQSDAKKSYVAGAVLAFADACRLPSLTPSCPFYTRTSQGPTCKEECRDLVEEYGGDSRPVTQVDFGGLVLTGRAIPKALVTGYQPFDAAERFLADRALPVREQCTGSLLLGLKGQMCRFPEEEQSARLSRVLEIYGELDRRGFPAEDVVAAGVVPEMARMVSTFIVVTLIDDSKAWPDSVSQEMVTPLVAAAKASWRPVLDSLMDNLGEGAVTRLLAEDIRSGSLAAPELPPGVEPPDVAELGLQISQEASLRVGFAHSRYFQNLVKGWLQHLVYEDTPSLLSWRAPASAQLLSVYGARTGANARAGWLWDRHTVTNIDEWQQASFALEWAAQRGQMSDAPPNVLADRTIDLAAIATSAMDSAGAMHLKRKSRKPAMDADKAASRAAQLLSDGRHQEAADIFAGLIDIRPTDGNARNNLGFCLLPIDPAEALRMLQSASLYPNSNLLVTWVNRAMALHLTGRNADAVGALESAAALLPEVDGPRSHAWLWRHERCGAPLELKSGWSCREAIQELRDHLA